MAELDKDLKTIRLTIEQQRQVEDNYGLAVDRAVAKYQEYQSKYKILRFELDDFISIASSALCIASQKFEPERNIAFSTYVYTKIDYYIQKEIEQGNSIVSVPRTDTIQKSINKAIKAGNTDKVEAKQKEMYKVKGLIYGATTLDEEEDISKIETNNDIDYMQDIKTILTQIEYEVALMMVEKYTMKEIKKELYLSTQEYKEIRKEIQKKVHSMRKQGEE